MPNAATLDQYGAVEACTCNICVSIRPSSDPRTLETCMACGGLYGEGVTCNCRPCPACTTIFNSATQTLCSSCLETYPLCSYCGGVGDGALRDCNHCNIERLCSQCIRRHRDCANPVRIHSYSYKPPAQFAGEGPLYLGVELEVDRAINGGRERAWRVE